MNIVDYSEWKVLYKIPKINSDKKDTILIKIYFPDEFPFENPLIDIEYFSIGFKNAFRNNNEYKFFMGF